MLDMCVAFIYLFLKMFETILLNDFFFNFYLYLTHQIIQKLKSTNNLFLNIFDDFHFINNNKDFLNRYLSLLFEDAYLSK